MTVPVVAVTRGAFGYRGQVVVEAELAVMPGEVVALVGANGSGKSTLLKGMLGLLPALAGVVRVFGTPVASLRDRTRIGYVPQRQATAGPLPFTVRELVQSGRLARKGLRRRAGVADDRAVAEAIATVGLGDLARLPVARLSGGQQRRALVARALAGGPDALFLDEPLAGIDQHNRQALGAALSELVDRGATVVVVLHELGPLRPLISRVIALDEGQVRYDGDLAAAPADLAGGFDHDAHGGELPRRGLGLSG